MHYEEDTEERNVFGTGLGSVKGDFCESSLEIPRRPFVWYLGEYRQEGERKGGGCVH